MDKWLTDLGLHEYWLNFKQNVYDNPKALEDLKVMNADDLVALLHDDLEIWKSGHVKKLTLAIRKLQYPSTRMSNNYHVSPSDKLPLCAPRDFYEKSRILLAQPASRRLRGCLHEAYTQGQFWQQGQIWQ